MVLTANRLLYHFLVVPVCPAATRGLLQHPFSCPASRLDYSGGFHWMLILIQGAMIAFQQGHWFLWTPSDSVHSLILISPGDSVVAFATEHSYGDATRIGILTLVVVTVGFVGYGSPSSESNSASLMLIRHCSLGTKPSNPFKNGLTTCTRSSSTGRVPMDKNLVTHRTGKPARSSRITRRTAV